MENVSDEDVTDRNVTDENITAENVDDNESMPADLESVASLLLVFNPSHD